MKKRTLLALSSGFTAGCASRSFRFPSNRVELCVTRFRYPRVSLLLVNGTQRAIHVLDDQACSWGCQAIRSQFKYGNIIVSGIRTIAFTVNIPILRAIPPNSHYAIRLTMRSKVWGFSHPLPEGRADGYIRWVYQTVMPTPEVYPHVAMQVSRLDLATEWVRLPAFSAGELRRNE